MIGRKYPRNAWTTLTCLLALASLILAGCAQGTPAPAAATQPNAASNAAAPSTGQGGAKTVHLALVLGDMSNPFFTTLGDAATAEAKKLGNVDLTVLGSNTLEEQVKALDDQISAKVDLIGFDPFDAQAVIPTVQQANAAGIPVFTVDSSAAGGTIDTYIGTDNVEGGTLAGEWLAKAMDGAGNLAIIEGDPGDSTNNAREQGLHSVIDKTDIKVVAALPAGWARDKGLQVMTDILTAHPDLNAVMAMNDEMALGAVQAIKAAGKSDQIKVVGYNGALEAIKAVYTGDMAADVVQYPEEMGRLFVDWAVRDLNGQKPPALLHPNVNVVDSELAHKGIAAVNDQPLVYSTSPASTFTKKVHLALVLGDMSNPFFTTLGDAATAEAKSLGNVDLTVLGSNTLEEQVKALDDQISAKVDLIGFDPFDAQAVIPTVQQANAAGIPVFTVDSSAAGGTIDTYIGTDNVQGGVLAGEWLAKAMDGAGNLAIIEGDPGDSTNNAREQGLHSVIDKTDIKVVAALPAGWARDKGLQVMTDILTAHPDLNAVMAMNDEMALGAVQAIKAAGKSDQIKVVGYNGALEAIKAVYTGDMAADVVQYPEGMGKLFVDWAVLDLNGQKPPALLHPNVDVVDTQLLAKVKLAVGQ